MEIEPYFFYWQTFTSVTTISFFFFPPPGAFQGKLAILWLEEGENKQKN